MAGSYTKTEFGVGPEEQTLLKDSNGTRIVPKSAEPVRLSPGWEGTNKPDDELNFKGITMDQATLELNPPRDRLNIVLFIMILHGIGALMPWNMFITAKSYFVDYKLHQNYTGVESPYSENFLPYVGVFAQVPNFLFNWLNIFLPLAGNLTTRIVWGIFIQVLVFVFTVILAMTDTSEWPTAFFWITMSSVVILNTSNGIYQNSVFGMAAKLPGKYTGAVVFGANFSGAFTSVISLLSMYFSPNARTAAIYYFITALFVLLACFDTYFALPINRFYRYHEYMYQKESQTKKIEFNGRDITRSPPLWKVFKQCWVQCFNIWFIFFVTLALFPAVQSDIHPSLPEFMDLGVYYPTFMCFLTFNVCAMVGSFIASWIQWPNKNWIIVPVLLRAAFIPLFLLCRYVPRDMLPKGYQIGEMVLNREHVYIDNDWIFLGLAIAMAVSSGYLSSNAMMYCSSVVEPQYASTAGMYAAAFLVTGVCSGVGASYVFPHIAKAFLPMLS